MEYNQRFTKRQKHDNVYIYINKCDSMECVQQLGIYEDFGLSPVELAKTLTEYELQKPQEMWDMDKIEKWQHIISIAIQKI